MVQRGYKRKLAAILSADVEGYSRLMGEDEEATVRTITAYRGVFAALSKQHDGRIVDSPGDNLLKALQHSAKRQQENLFGEAQRFFLSELQCFLPLLVSHGIFIYGLHPSKKW